MLEDGLFGISQKYDRQAYDKACIQYKVKKHILLGLGLVILLATLVISPGIWVLFEAFVFAVVIFFILVKDTSVDDNYEKTFLIPYIRDKFCGEYKRGFDFVSNLNPNASFEAIEATKIFQVLSFGVTGGNVRCMIDGHVNSMNIKIYNYERRERSGDSTIHSLGVLIVLPLVSRIAEPVLISRASNYVDRPVDMDRYEYDGMLIWTRHGMGASGEETGVDCVDEKKREDALGEIIRSESFLDVVSDAYTQIGGWPNIYFYEDKAYIYMRIQQSIYSKVYLGEKNHELEALEEDTGIFWPFCEALMTRTDVFGDARASEVVPDE